MIYYTNSDKETEAVGEQFGRTVKDGTVVAMYGDLGAGKTAFVRARASMCRMWISACPI